MSWLAISMDDVPEVGDGGYAELSLGMLDEEEVLVKDDEDGTHVA